MRMSIVVLGSACLLLVHLAGPAWSGSAPRDDLDLRAGLLIDGITARGDGEQPEFGGAGGAPGEKSVVRAMLLSALLPGLGEIYAGGTRGYAVGGAMAALDALSIWRYVANNGSGDDEKGNYQAFARYHYSRDSLYAYVEAVVAPWSGSAELDKCRHSSVPPDTYDRDACLEQKLSAFPLSPVGSDDYYQQLSGDDRYMMGWDDWDPYVVANHEVYWTGWNPGDPMPEGLPQTTANLEEYRRMRESADDFYSLSERYAWIMVVGRVVSMIDTAILVKIRNRDLAGLGTNPRLTFKADLLGSRSVRVGLKMRF
jgi:hypothetical protein